MGSVLHTYRTFAGLAARPAPLDAPARGARPVLAAVDVGRTADLVLARRVVEAARAASRGALHVVHAWRLTGETILACPVRGTGRWRLRGIYRRVREERTARLAALTRGLGAHLHVVHARPGRGVLRIARRVRTALVVMGAPTPPPFPAVVLSGMAEVLGGDGYSVLLVPRHPLPGSASRPALIHP